MNQELQDDLFELSQSFISKYTDYHYLKENYKCEEGYQNYRSRLNNLTNNNLLKKLRFAEQIENYEVCKNIHTELLNRTNETHPYYLRKIELMINPKNIEKISQDILAKDLGKLIK